MVKPILFLHFWTDYVNARYLFAIFVWHCQYESKIAGFYMFRFKEMLHSSLVQKKRKASYWRWETIAGVIAGFSTSIITISFIRILQPIKSWFHLTSVARVFSHTNIIFFKRTCFLVAYFSFMGWLTIQYGKRLGLPEIRRVYNY